MSDAGMVEITPENIGELFGNGENEAEGWGVFLVQPWNWPLAPRRLEVQAVDGKGIFPDDAAARSHVRRRARDDARVRGVLRDLSAADPAAYLQMIRA